MWNAIRIGDQIINLERATRIRFDPGIRRIYFYFGTEASWDAPFEWIEGDEAEKAWRHLCGMARRQVPTEKES